MLSLLALLVQKYQYSERQWASQVELRGAPWQNFYFCTSNLARLLAQSTNTDAEGAAGGGGRREHGRRKLLVYEALSY